MDIRVIGGGPAGLYAAILLKKRFGDADVRVFERNRPDDERPPQQVICRVADAFE